MRRNILEIELSILLEFIRRYEDGDTAFQKDEYKECKETYKIKLEEYIELTKDNIC